MERAEVSEKIHLNFKFRLVYQTIMIRKESPSDPWPEWLLVLRLGFMELHFARIRFFLTIP
ncbi:hypothetical protein [Leptospira stimsonii]|uniref:hypothetical protein n=1 Tax=Leptospira stimsonii TaxID=2202203 RepID=UPI0011C3C4E6|nr:hypothetical protein [Leptospira stimsonii]